MDYLLLRCVGLNTYRRVLEELNFMLKDISLQRDMRKESRQYIGENVN